MFKVQDYEQEAQIWQGCCTSVTRKSWGSYIHDAFSLKQDVVSKDFAGPNLQVEILQSQLFLIDQHCNTQYS